MSAQDTKYRLRPRYLGVAFVSMSIGVVLVAAGATITPDKVSALFALVTGMAGIFLGFAYLRSPVWRLAVDLQEKDVVVWNGHDERMRVGYHKFDKVVVGPDRESLFLDGGDPDHSLLIPGPDAPAPYTIRNKAELIEKLLERIPEELLTTAEAEAAKKAEESCSTGDES